MVTTIAHIRRHRRRAWLGAVVVLATITSACGSDDDADDSASDTTTETSEPESTTSEAPATTAETSEAESTASDAPATSEATEEPAAETTEPSTETADDPVAAALERAYAGVLGELPADAPEPTDAQSIWMVSCGELALTCSEPSAKVIEAAEAIGWSGQVCDGQLNPQGWSDCIRQGLSTSADAIITVGVDCVAIAGALAEAKAQNVTTINLGATDCDIVGEEPLFTAVVPNLDGYTQEEWWRQAGALQADWVIGQTNGDANVLLLEFVDPLWGEWVAEGFADQLATCDGCTVGATLELTNQDFVGGTLVSKFSTALVEAADVNAVAVPIDAWLLAGLGQAIEETGRSDDLAVIGAVGAAGNFELIREGRGQDATVAFAFGLSGYTAIDAMIRVLAGEPVEHANLGLQVVDAEHNLPERDETFRYVPPLDIESHYLSIWGVE